MIQKTIILLSILSVSLTTTLAKDDKAAQEEKFNRAYLSLYGKENIIKETIHKKSKIEKEFLSLNNLKISNQVENLYLQSVCNINIHPQFPKTIIFPENIKVTEAEPFPGTIKTEIDKSGMNVIKITPTTDLKKEVISIFYLEGNDRQKKHMTILIDNYIYKANKNIPLYLITKLTKIKLLEPNQILKYYYDKNKKYPENGSSIKIKKNGKWQIYQFVSDPINWDLIIRDKTYRIVY